MIVTESQAVSAIAECTHERARPQTVVREAGEHLMLELSLVCETCGKRIWFLTPSGPKLTASVPMTWDDDVAKEHAGRSTKQAKQSPEQVVARIRQKLGEGPGTEMAVMLWEKGIVASCEACDKLARQMNEWGDDCRKHLDEIVDDILPRAQEWIRKNRPSALRTFVDETRLPSRVKDWLAGNAEVIDKAALAAGALVNVETPIVKAKVRAFVVQALDKWESE